MAAGIPAAFKMIQCSGGFCMCSNLGVNHNCQGKTAFAKIITLRKLWQWGRSDLANPLSLAFSFKVALIISGLRPS